AFVFRIDIVPFGAEKHCSYINRVQNLTDAADERALTALHRQDVRLCENDQRKQIYRGRDGEDLIDPRTHLPRFYLVIIEQDVVRLCSRGGRIGVRSIRSFFKHKTPNIIAKKPSKLPETLDAARRRFVAE